MSTSHKTGNGRQDANQRKKGVGHPRRMGAFLFANGGMAGAEAAMLALLFVGLGLMVAHILRPGIKEAAKNLNQELAGGVSQ